MYALHTFPVGHQCEEAKMKHEDAAHRTNKASTEGIGARPRGPSQKRRHQSISDVETRKEPWMKHQTISSKDLIWGSCNRHEEEFMHPTSPPLSRSVDPLMRMSAALSSVPGNASKLSIPMDRNDLSMDSGGGLDFPRFRPDFISGHDDVELQMEQLQTTLLRSSSSGSLSYSDLEKTALSYSSSFIQSQRDIMSRIMCDSQRRTFALEEELEQASCHYDHTSTSSANIITSPHDGAHLAFSGTRAPRAAVSNPSSSTSSREEAYGGTGSKVRIHNDQRVFAALEEGTARLLQCVGCARHMMASNDIKLVYCPGCGTLTPFELGLVPPGTNSRS